jgi:hypothetical protein
LPILNPISSRVDSIGEFARLKRKKWHWSFLASGEWSQSPYHQGNLTLEFAVSKDGSHVAILENGFPRRILAISRKQPDEGLEPVLSRLLFYIRHRLDIYMGSPDSRTDKVNFDKVWEGYNALCKQQGRRPS